MLGILQKDFEKYGCTNCGSANCRKDGYIPQELKLYTCDDCGEKFAVMIGYERRAWLMRSGETEIEEIELVKHPLSQEQ